MLKTKRLVGGKNNQTWAGWNKLESSPPSAPDSTKRKDGKNQWGSSVSFSHILCYLRSIIQFKGTSIKPPDLHQRREFLFLSFNVPFPFELTFFRFPPSTYVPTKLARVLMKECSIFSLDGISKVRVLSFEQSRNQPH